LLTSSSRSNRKPSKPTIKLCTSYLNCKAPKSSQRKSSRKALENRKNKIAYSNRMKTMSTSSFHSHSLFLSSSVIKQQLFAKKLTSSLTWQSQKILKIKRKIRNPRK
jgi:hypothetical protein